MRRYTPSNIRTIPPQAKKVFTGEIYQVFQWPQKMFDGSVETFEMISRPDTVKVIAVKDNKLIISHERQPAKDWYYDFPGGRHDHPEEDELAAAKRELREETGMEFKKWRLIRVQQPFTKIDWLVYVFLATGFERQVEPHHDAGEEIEVKEYTFEELVNLVKSGRTEYTRSADIAEYASLDDLLAAPSLYDYEQNTKE